MARVGPQHHGAGGTAFIPPAGSLPCSQKPPPVIRIGRMSQTKLLNIVFHLQGVAWK